MYVCKCLLLPIQNETPRCDVVRSEFKKTSLWSEHMISHHVGMAYNKNAVTGGAKGRQGALLEGHGQYRPSTQHDGREMSRRLRRWWNWCWQQERSRDILRQRLSAIECVWLLVYYG